MSAPGLTQQHQTYLINRKVAAETAYQRGYRSVGHNEARRWGFAAPPGHPLDGLLMPCHGVDGRNGRYQLRLDTPIPDPDKPGSSGGRFLNQRGVAAKGVDVHPGQRPRLTDTQVPRFLTEGVPKVDALASAGYLGLGLTGVWMGVDKTDSGYRLHPELEAACPSGSLLFMAFDSDQATNPNVHHALRVTGGLLHDRGVLVLYLTIPAAADGGKQGIDDYLAAGGSLAELIANASTALPELEGSDGASVCRCPECPDRRKQAERRQLDDLEARILTAPKGKGIKPSLRVPALTLLWQVAADTGQDQRLPARRKRVDADGWDALPLKSWSEKHGQGYGTSLKARAELIAAGAFEERTHYEPITVDRKDPTTGATYKSEEWTTVTDVRLPGGSIKAALQKMTTIVHAKPENHGGARWRCPKGHDADIVLKRVCSECGEEAEQVPTSNRKLENAPPATSKPTGSPYHQPSTSEQLPLEPKAPEETFSLAAPPIGSDFANATAAVAEAEAIAREAATNLKLEKAGQELHPAQRELLHLIQRLDFAPIPIGGTVVRGTDGWVRFIGDPMKARLWAEALRKLKELEPHWGMPE